MQKSTENVLVSPKYRALHGNRDQGIEWWCQNFNRKFINGRSCACADKIWPKIALNAVILPKFEPVNGISWSPRKIMVKDLRQRSGLAWFCARAESWVVFNTGPYTVLPDNSILITANMQSEMGFPSSHQLKTYVASKSRLKLVAHAVLSVDAGLLVTMVNLWEEMVQVFTSQMLSLWPRQQHQRTEGNSKHWSQP